MRCSDPPSNPHIVSAVRGRSFITLLDPWCYAGINCGVLLIRNTEWAHTFFADVGQYSYMDKATLDRDVRPVRPAQSLTKHDSRLI